MQVLANYQAGSTRPRMEQRLEVEVVLCGSPFAGERGASNGMGAMAYREIRLLCEEDKPLNGQWS